MRTSALFSAKTSNFEIYGVSHGQEGGVVSQCGQGEGSVFRDFLWKSFMDVPLRYNFSA